MTGSTAQPPDQIRYGIVLIVASVFLMSSADALVKHISTEVTLWQIFALRSALAVPVCILVLRLRRRPGDFGCRRLGWVLLRSALLVAMWLAYYGALPFVPLSLAAASLYTAPLFVALLSAALVREPVGGQRWLALLAGFVGTLLILRPDTETFSSAMLLPLVAALCYALAMLITRSKCREESPLAMSFNLNLAFLLTGLAGSGLVFLADLEPQQVARAPFLLDGWAPLSGWEWSWMVMLALLFVAVAAGVAKAYQCAPPAIVATFDYAYLIFASLWGLILFSEPPDLTRLAGIFLIASAGVLVVRVSRPAPSVRDPSVRAGL